MNRRELMVATGLCAFAPSLGADVGRAAGAVVRPGVRLEFPRDHGAHPEFRIEWWYVTGWLETEDRLHLGFQLTFFRARPGFVTANPSRFVTHQVILAHAAIADPQLGRLLHDQRAAREALGLAGALPGHAEVWIDRWRLEQAGTGFRADIGARDFRLQLELEARGEVLLHGQAGVSRKGAREGEASYYYSIPRLSVHGAVMRAGRSARVSGTGWFDHEWSSSYLAPEAVGWDWAGINMDDGAALMVYRMRNRDGHAHHAGGSLRSANGRLRIFRESEVQFDPVTLWRSPRTGVSYPVGMRIKVPGAVWRLDAIMPDQELDARASTGTIYWEGAVRAVSEDGAQAGRGYLELTGYGEPMRM